jgi:hypothetical protein
MAQLKRPLRSDDARGRLGQDDVVFTHTADGRPVARKFTKAVDANSALQQVVRAKFGTAALMFKKAWDDYSAIPLAARSAYEAAAVKYQADNPIATKKFAAGFESGAAQDRAYYLGRAVSDDLLITKIASGDLKNSSTTQRFFAFVDATGTLIVAGGINPVAVGATVTPPAGSIAVIVSAAVLVGTATALTDPLTFPQTGVLDAIVIATMGIGS